jgi:peptidyl-prolyl cis-trans isomerase SurA
MMRLFSAFLVITAFWTIMLAPSPAVAQTKVVALVNDEPLTNFQVRARAKFMTVTARRPAGEALRREALDQLIEEQIKLQEARRLGISVESGQIDSAYGRMAKRLDMNGSQLTKAFRQAGVDPDTLKRRIRADIAWQQVVQARFRQEVRVREQDVIQAMGRGDTTTNSQQQTATEYQLQQVVVIVPQSASDAEKARRRAIAEQFRSRFSGCAGTQGLVQQFRDVVFRDIGKRSSSQFSDEQDTMLQAVPIGGLSEPVDSDTGYQMFAVCSKQQVEDDSAQRREVEEKLRSERGNILARRLLIDLRQNAIIERR